ncbi:MAG TPA: redoxin domain-containing protein [Polyangiaceae bacterium]|nr:redoxin domain-containing protein [Polyangiaceae bacterium]
MRLVPGLRAPSFVIKALTGQTYTLEQLRGELVWLAFFRFATCPLCNLRVHQLVDEWERTFAGKIHLFAIFQSPKERFTNYVSKYEPPFELVSDVELALYQQFGVETRISATLHPKVATTLLEARRADIPLFDGPKDGGSFRVPADFLIDRNGVLRVCRYGEHLADSIASPDVLTFIGEHAQTSVNPGSLPPPAPTTTPPQSLKT